ncbi:mRNA 3'-end-processing protein YTH1 [Golovinomyces cichoracearum]|uniref:mRNA 3'-end-processing protein n=1 Tax=Golovinomyces cichoracearum TaxID=62708 RepID=A0A420H6L2_9PEZI|nr:mRNA 3'-end-processing protein YTH1 [Golovinomyces cichoracearum]
MAGITSYYSEPRRLARKILEHHSPEFNFTFSPYINQTFGFGLSPNRPVCKAYLQGHCPSGLSCPEKHNNNGQNFNNLVCKHWLRGLCKKGDSCEFLHEYNLRKMPECNFFTRHGYCSNGEECLYLHLDPSSKLPPCPHYEKGFCILGPLCSQRHVRKVLCEFYLAGFCPEGKNCKNAHARWPENLPKATKRVIKSPDEIEEEQRILIENAERELASEREKFGDRGNENRTRARWHSNGQNRGGSRGGNMNRRTRYH